eukprot:633756_1
MFFFFFLFLYCFFFFFFFLRIVSLLTMSDSSEQRVQLVAPTIHRNKTNSSNFSAEVDTSPVAQETPFESRDSDKVQKSKSHYGCYLGIVIFICIGLIAWNAVLTSEIEEIKSEPTVSGSKIANDTRTITANTSIIATNTPTISLTTTPTIDLPSTSNIDPTTTPTIQLCDNEDYFKQVLKEEHSQRIGGLIKNIHQDDQYEASGVLYDILRDVYWVVFDNLHSISKLSSDLARSDDNLLVSPSTDIKINKDDDGYEGITHDFENDVFYLLTESVGFDDENDDTFHHPLLRAVVYDEHDTFTQTQICAVDYVMPTDNKGLEGVAMILIDGIKYFVGLCEGNYCSYSDEGKDPGHGRLVLFKYEATSIVTDETYKYLISEGIECIHEVMNVYALPTYIAFIDYSDINFMSRNDSDVSNQYYVAIVSQASVAFWMGEVTWSLVDGPVFNDDYDGQIYEFPRGGDCEVIFCGVEGVTFVNEYEFVMVSDKAKKGSPWLCGTKSESIHILKLP